MPARLTDRKKKKFAAAYVDSGFDGLAAYKMYKPDCVKDSAANMGAVRMLKDPTVKKFIDELVLMKEKIKDHARHSMVILDEDTEELVKKITINEMEVIGQYVDVCSLDHADYYHKNGKAKQLKDLTKRQRSLIKDIKWQDSRDGKSRKVQDYIFEGRDKARDQLAKITGIVNPAFDFNGLIAIITGKNKEEVDESVNRLNHAEGVNFDDIKQRIKAVNGEIVE